MFLEKIALGLGLLTSYTFTLPTALQQEYSRQGIRYGSFVSASLPVFGMRMGIHTGYQRFSLNALPPYTLKDFRSLDLATGFHEFSFLYSLPELSLELGPKLTVFYGSDSSFSTKSQFPGTNPFVGFTIQYSQPIPLGEGQYRYQISMEGLKSLALQNTNVQAFGTQIQGVWSPGQGLQSKTSLPEVTPPSVSIPPPKTTILPLESTPPPESLPLDPIPPSTDPIPSPILPSLETDLAPPPDFSSLNQGLMDSMSNVSQGVGLEALDPTPPSLPAEGVASGLLDVPSDPVISDQDLVKKHFLLLNYVKNQVNTGENNGIKLKKWIQSLKKEMDWSSLSLNCFHSRAEKVSICKKRISNLKLQIGIYLGKRKAQTVFETQIISTKGKGKMEIKAW